MATNKRIDKIADAMTNMATKKSGWSDAAREASKVARGVGSGGATAPSFSDFAKRHYGDKYVLAKPTAKNKERYEGHTFVSQGQNDALKEKYKQQHPEAHQAYFGLPAPNSVKPRRSMGRS